MPAPHPPTESPAEPRGQGCEDCGVWQAGVADAAPRPLCTTCLARRNVASLDAQRAEHARAGWRRAR